MAGTRIAEGETIRLGRIEGDLTAGGRVVIEAEGGAPVVVTGRAVFEGDAEIRCDFECGSLRVRGEGLFRDQGTLKVVGDLVVHGDIDVDREIDATGTIRAGAVEVGGRLTARSLYCRNAEVGGSLEVKEALEADRVASGGRLVALGSVKIRDLDVGGTAEIGGGRVDDIDVGGSISVRGELAFSSIDVGGRLELGSKSEGERLDVGGRVRAGGDLRCAEVDVGGVIEVEGNLTGSDVDVGGTLWVGKDVALAGDLRSGGSAEVLGEVTAVDLDAGGRFKAKRAVLSGDANVGGGLETELGLKADRVELGRDSRCVGVLVGRRIEIGSFARVEDVYADELSAEREVRAGKVFARRADFGRGCSVGQVVYTEALTGEELRQESPAQRVEKLPPAPL